MDLSGRADPVHRSFKNTKQSGLQANGFPGQKRQTRTRAPGSMRFHSAGVIQDRSQQIEFYFPAIGKQNNPVFLNYSRDSLNFRVLGIQTPID